LLANSPNLPKGVSTIVNHHHERLDGSGYPDGLKGTELNQLARMAGIIDVFCAMTDRRPYRRTTPAHAALETMAVQMCDQLDQDLLIRFKEILLDSVEPQALDAVAA
jgi:HD-GYP domain-containing protein (c-di-GMP phosphodiesterase class II)